MLQDATFALANRFGGSSEEISLYENVFVVDMGTPGLWQGRGSNRWPYVYSGLERNSVPSLQNALLEALAEAWDVSFAEVAQAYYPKEKKNRVEMVVGTRDNKPVKLDGYVLKKPGT